MFRCISTRPMETRQVANVDRQIRPLLLRSALTAVVLAAGLIDAARAGLRELVERLDEDRREAFHAAFVELFETYREGDRVRAPRRYLMTLGRRR